MKVNQKIRVVMCGLAVLLISHPFINAQGIKSNDIDAIVKRSMETFNVPGMAVAIIKDGNVIHNKGYGVRSIGSEEKVDDHTLFAIASNSKAFTSAALGILVDEKKLNWDDRVIDYIPEFRLYNSYVTEEFTIRDMLTHRSGLGLGAGDLMIFPDSNDFIIDELIHNMRYLKPVSGFRSKYDYDNQLYIIAGEVVARISGTSWAEFVEKRIMEPLQMKNSAGNFQRLKDRGNVAAPHVIVEGNLEVVDRYDLELVSAAGGIYSNISDMGKWVAMQLNLGKYGHEKQLFSKDVQKEMWTPQTIIRQGTGGTYNTHFNAYGLGWRICDVKGYLQVSHTGGLPGMVTQVILLPELNLGIIVLTNQQSSESFMSVSNAIKDRFLSIEGVDHIKNYYQSYLSATKVAGEKTKLVWEKINAMNHATNTGSHDISRFTGTYKDNWFKEVLISKENGKLRFESKRSPKLVGDMFWYTANTFVVKWDDRSMDADAFVLFELDYQGQPTGMHMKAISPLTDFSYDFHDLDFYRIDNNNKIKN